MNLWTSGEHFAVLFDAIRFFDAVISKQLRIDHQGVTSIYWYYIEEIR